MSIRWIQRTRLKVGRASRALLVEKHADDKNRGLGRATLVSPSQLGLGPIRKRLLDLVWCLQPRWRQLPGTHQCPIDRLVRLVKCHGGLLVCHAEREHHPDSEIL